MTDTGSDCVIVLLENRSGWDRTNEELLVYHVNGWTVIVITNRAKNVFIEKGQNILEYDYLHFQLESHSKTGERRSK